MKPYSETAPELETIEQSTGPLILEFGNDWCGYCQDAQFYIEKVIGTAANSAPHIKVADGKGKRLGRAFKVKLWPTLIFLLDGKEIGRVVRPHSTLEISDELNKITTSN